MLYRARKNLLILIESKSDEEFDRAHITEMMAFLYFIRTRKGTWQKHHLMATAG